MSGPRRARTVDPRIKSPLLYRLSYRPHFTLNKTVLTFLTRVYANRIGKRLVLNPAMGCAKTAPGPKARALQSLRSAENQTIR
jgi:hypothetical protein